MPNFVKNPIGNLLILCLILLLVIWGSYNMIYRAVIVYDRSETLRQEADVLTQKKQRLVNELRELQSQTAVAREAKSRLNLKFPGEEVVVVAEPQGNTKTLEQNSPTIWQKIAQWLRGIVTSY